MKARRAVSPSDEIVVRLSETLQDAVDLLRAAAYSPAVPGLEESERGTLLQQCLEMCDQHATRQPDPVRTLHHFACTGGTLISKCVAAMPNVQLLSEMSPLSEMLLSQGKPEFAPSDMIRLLRQSTRGARRELVVDIFRSELRIVYEDALRQGQRLVIRDHTHSDYCNGVAVADRPTLRELIQADLPLLSAVTVRNPIDSMSSLLSLGWVNFQPGTLDEYCRRYGNFLDDHRDLPVVRYEDFVSTPIESMRALCKHLALPFTEEFADLFSVFRLSGESGRAGDTIAPRPSLPAALAIRDEARRSEHCLRLLDRLGYAGPDCDGERT